MAQTNVQAFSGDVEISSNLVVDTNTLFVDSVGNKVGIGVTIPGYKLDIQDSSDAADFVSARLYSAANASGVSNTSLKLEKGSGYGGIVKGFLSQGVGSGLSLHTLNSGTDLQAMTIMETGNVGIGTTNPGTKLSAYDISSNLTAVSIITKGGSVQNQPSFSILDMKDAVGAGGYIRGFHNPYVSHGIQFGSIVSNSRSTELMTILSTGFVGIGTQAPRAKMDIFTGSTSTAGIILDRYSTGNYRTEFYQADTGLAIHVGHSTLVPTEKMRIDYNGIVGIGTITPSSNSRLTIYKPFTYPGHGNQTGTDSTSSITWKSNLNTAGGSGAPVYSTYVQDAASIFFQPRSYQYVGSPHSGHHGCLHMSAGYSPQSVPTTPSNFALSSANGLGIGTADPNSFSLDLFQRQYRARNNVASYIFGIGDSEFFIYGNANRGVYIGWNNTYWSANSDRRAKKNFTPIENSLAKLRNINPVLFHYLDEEDTDNKRLGFIAQDWLAQQPECVDYNESTGNLTLSLSETTPVLCAAIKELDSNQQGIQEVVNNLSDFTGQHRCLMKDISPNDYPKYEGLVVSANNNEYLNHDSITKPTINEALPIVSLTNKEKDKTCLGVISLKADPESYLPDDPTRLKINALGEGGIWTININGSLESGDYITSSNIAGYGMRQDDDIIHNYTIAKITQDCDFTKKMRKIKTLVKELKDITYYKFTYKVIISKDEYDVTDESLRLAEDYEYYSREQIRSITDDSPGLYESNGYQRIDDIQTVSKEEYDQNQSLYDKRTKYKIKDSDEIVSIDEEIYNLDPSKYDVEVIYTTKSMHLSKEEYDKNPSLYDVIKIKIKKCKCDKDKFDEMKDEDGMKHEFKLAASTKYYKLDKQETTEPQPGYETEVRQELVNVLDENGQLTWTESEETETEYDLRYLTSDGSQTDEANNVHIAAFVGCTYHCG